MRYQHRQIGTTILAILAIVLVLVGLSVPNSDIRLMWPALAIPAVVAGLFYSLNVNVTSSEISWSFGPGFWRKSIALHEIEDAKIITTKWYNGWGIRYTFDGWLYCVSGNTAIQLILKNGDKVSIGTDDANNLLEALRQSTRQ
ncbi:hypothetical protein [Pseudoalteromonas sp. GB56]